MREMQCFGKHIQEIGMSHTVEVRGVRIGEGIPKIIVPIVAETREEILRDARNLRESGCDLVEWRADWFDNVFSFDRVREILEELRGILGDRPLLFTFRTKKEGGEKEIDPEAYAELNIRAAETGSVDLIDAELFTGDEIVSRMITEAHAACVKVITSSHDFQHTPEKQEILARLLKMKTLGADILKVAVMPESRRDVITLLDATESFSSENPDVPIITMSMSGCGLVSRLSGESFGSAATFGAVGKTSAPGQIDAETLGNILEVIHKNS